MADNFNISDVPESAGPKSVEVPGDIADGTAGDLMTWDAAGVASLIGIGAATFVLTSNGAGAEPTWQAAGGGGAVTSVFTRTGAVVAAASDYDASQVDNDSGVAGAFVDDALDNLAAAIPPAAPVDSVFSRTGVVVAAASDYDAGQVDNDSSIAGAFVDDALNNLDNAVVQMRRTTDFAVPTVWADVSLDTIDVETDSNIVDGEAGTPDRVTLEVDGAYEIHYHFSIGPTQDTNSVSIVEARVRINDTTVIPGSELHAYVFNDSSIESDDIAGFLSGTCVVEGDAADFVSLQVQQIEQDGSPTPDLLAGTIVMTVKRLTQQA